VQSWGCLGGSTVARSTASDRSSATAGRSASTYSPTRSLSAGTDNDAAESTPTAPYAHMQPAMLSICTFYTALFTGQFRTAQSLDPIANKEREPITGGGAPAAVQGAEPPVGVRVFRPFEADCLLYFANLPHY